MVTFIKKVLQILGGRVARNLYFWFFLYYIKVFDTTHLEGAYSDTWYYGLVALNIAFFVVLSYLNNLVLIPKLLARKKVGMYLLIMIPFIFWWAFLYTWHLKALLIYLPKLENVYAFSIISSPLEKDISFSSVLGEMETNCITMVIWTFIFTSLWYLHDYNKKEKQVKEALRKQTEAELSFLKNQINPHFLFNTLNNLYGLALKKSDEAPDSILKLSAILRYLLYESNVERVPFEKEKEIMQAYIDLELLRMEENNDFHFTISADKNYNIAPLLWLAVLENVFKHGTRFINDALFIDYRFEIKEGKLSIYSKNKYKKNVKEVDVNIGGIGMDNLKKRLNLLYPGKFRFDVREENDFFIVEVLIELE